MTATEHSASGATGTWQLVVSRSTGEKYYFDTSTGRSAWYDASLPAGWGCIAGDDGERMYLELATGKRQADAPFAKAETTSSELDVPAGQPQPAPSNVAFDVYVPEFRSRDPWLIHQLGPAAVSELAWWRAAQARVQGLPAPTAVLPSSSPDAHSALAAELIAAARATLGDAALAAAWDPRKHRYVIRREMVPSVAELQDHGDEREAEGGRSPRKRARAADAPATSSTVEINPSVTLPVVRSRDRYPSVQGSAVYTEPAFSCSAFIKSIYESGKVTTGSGIVKKLNAGVGPRESRHMYDIVRDNGFTRCLEVGMANGMSALSMCQALADGGHPGSVLVSIDPFQSSQWDNTARANLTRAGLSAFSTVLEETSFIAMPRLLQAALESKEPFFDLVFVDGMHLFDYTLVDMFYAVMLLRPGGVLLLDDVRHKGVRPAFDYVRTNYTHMQLVPDTVCASTLATFVKTGADMRSWDFHVPF